MTIRTMPVLDSALARCNRSGNDEFKMFLDKIIECMNKNSTILIQTPWLGTIGNCAEEIYFGLLKARREGKKVCFLFPKDAFEVFRFSRRKLNKELQYINSPFRALNERNLLVASLEWLISIIYYINIIISHIATISFKVIGRRISLPNDYIIPTLGQKNLWWPIGAETFDRTIVQQLQWGKQLQTFLPLSLPPSHEEQGQDIRVRMGIPLGDWFVCLHVREGGLYNDHKEAYFRNADIRNYFKAINEIRNRGGWVVRLGDNTMTKLPDMERVIDYAHSKYKCDLMDIYLIKECSLYIGSQSGIWDVAALFQKPLLMPNMCEWCFTYPQRPGDRGILKHVWSKSRKRFLSIQEMLTLSDRCQYIIDALDDDFVFHENSEDEIFLLVQEYYDGNNKQELSYLQREFNARRVYETYKIFECSKIWASSYNDIYNKFRLASRLEGCKGAIGNAFLNDNWEINSRSFELV